MKVDSSTQCIPEKGYVVSIGQMGRDGVAKLGGVSILVNNTNPGEEDMFRITKVGCTYAVAGESEEELMKNAAEHAVKDHGYKEEEIMTPEMKEKIKSYIQKT